MNFLCSVCRAKYKNFVKSCEKCGSHKFIEQKYDLLLPSGHVISGRYRIIDFLKSGGMGAVYRAEDTHLSRPCAIKELINPSFDDEDYKLAFSRFDREAKILSGLDHAGLPRIIDYFSSGNRHYLVMDYIEGEDLETILNEKYRNGFPVEDVIKWSSEICDVLTYLHTRNPPVIYRDIKPSNIMIRRSDGKVILIDFGIARILVPHTQRIYTITSVGTMGYMSPEQYRGKPDGRSDIYSLGACMHHLLTGKVPMPFTLEPLEDLRPDLSPHIKSIVMRSLRMKISERFQSASEMKKALMDTMNIIPSVKKERDEIDLLLEHMDSDEGDMRYIVLRTLRKYKEEEKILEPLLNLSLNDPDLIVRREACEILSDLQDKRIIDLFNKLIEDRDMEIKHISIKVIEKFKDPSSVEALGKALMDKEESISIKSALCLLHMKEKKYIPKILEFLEKQTDPYIKIELQEAVNNLDDSYLKNGKNLDKEKIMVTEKRYKKLLIYSFISVILLTVLVQASIKYSISLRYNRFMNEGKKFLDNYDYYSALECFSEGIKLKSDDPENLYFLGKTYIPLDQNKARFYLNKALKLNKNYPEALMAEGKLYLVEDNFKEAIKYLERSIELKEDLHQSYIYLGEAFYKSGDKIKAEEIFNRALLIDDNLIPATAWLKKIKSEKIPEYNKEKIALFLDEGKKFIDNNNYPAAMESYMKIININPCDSRGYSGIGRVCLLMKNINTSLQYFYKALEFDPLSAEDLCNIAFIYIQKGDYPQAISSLNRAVYTDPFNGRSRYLSGIAYKDTGQKDRSLSEFNIYLKFFPGGEYAEEIRNIMRIIEKK